MRKRAALIMSCSLLAASCSNVTTPSIPTKDTYTVSFNTHGGSPVETLHDIKLIENEPTTSRDGYNFAGWFESADYSERIEFPYTVTCDITLHAKWDEDISYDDVEIMRLNSGVGEAIAYMKASYEETYLNVIVRVSDKSVFNSYKNADGSVNGMNDNVEIYVSPRNDEVFGLIDNETINFLAVPQAGYQAKRFLNSLDYKYSYNYGTPFKDGYSVTSKLCNEADDKFDGYIVDFKIPYSLFGYSRDQMLGKTSIYLAMRNTDKGTGNDPTQYGESKFLGSELRNAWTHPILNSNNQLVNREVDALLVGDSYTDSEFFKKLKESYRGKGLYGRGISGSKASQWLNDYFPNIVASNPKKLFIHIGVNDINDGRDRSGVSTFYSLKSLMEKIHSNLPSTEIYWFTITDNHFVGIYEEGVNPYEAGYHYCNQKMKELAQTSDYLHVLDYAAITEGQISLFLQDGLHPNMMGYDIITDLIDKELNITRSSSTIFGKSGKYVSSSGFDYSEEADQIIVSNGDFNQYAWVKNEEPRSSFSFEVGLNAINVKHNDAYPKMGIVVKSGDRMLFYYIEMYAGLNGKKVGHVYHENYGTLWGSDFDWGKSELCADDLANDLNIKYTGDNYTKLKAVYENNELKLYVNDVLAFVESKPFNGEPAHFGLLSFNTAFRTNKIIVG